MNPYRKQEMIADELASVVVEDVLEEVKAAQGDAEAVLPGLQWLLDHLESHPPVLVAKDLASRPALERQLLGLSSFLRSVQDRPREAQAWSDETPTPDQRPLWRVQGRRIWERSRLH